MRYFDKKMGLLLILFMHIFLNIDFYCDIYSKLWSQKINFEVVSPKGRYMVEYYSLNQFVNLLTKHTRYSGYSRVYDNKKNAYVYESSVYDLIDCGILSFPNKMRPTIFSLCFETPRLELEE